MKSLVFFNNKGGVGKTTLICNVAAHLVRDHRVKVCIVDADPQCNATQYLFPEEVTEKVYNDTGRFTIQSVIDPLASGEGFQKTVRTRKSPSFGVDVLLGDPRLALAEDLLSRDWSDMKGGDIRGMRTSLVFSELLSRLNSYDYVLFDVGPSLGAINRAILLSSDFYVSPMSIDIFSLRAFENIAEWIETWKDDWKKGRDNVRDKSKVPDLEASGASFIGYVSQAYLQKRDASGNLRPVTAFERIRSQIDTLIENALEENDRPVKPYQIGVVPNLFSLVPMSQRSHKPVSFLKGVDGVVGAHFQKVKDADEVFSAVTEQIARRASNG